MADEPDNLVLRLLREIRTEQDVHGTKLDRIEKQVDDLYKISTHTLGVAANAHMRYETLEETINKLKERVERLEAKV
jgi:polyhydroxyalkanoate synthesis regulator phasin